MFKKQNKNFRTDLDIIIEKLQKKEAFAFSKYADGELHILANKPINNGEFWFKPEEDSFNRDKMIESFRYQNNNYYVGISCPCCIGGETIHKWMKKQSGQDTEHLTWANIFVNGNHQYYIDNMVPTYSDYEIVVVSNDQSNISDLPFNVKKHFKIGKNAWVEDYQMIDDIKQYIDADASAGHLFLFCAGPFGNILSHQLFEHNQKNTYIDIGSTLNTYLLGNAGYNRGYLRKEPTSKKMCVWSDE